MDISDNRKNANGIYARFVKRLLDLILSVLGLIILSPVFLVTAILVRVKLGSPVLFCQYRPGQNERIFKFYKFRSMTEDRDEEGNLLPDALRLTDFGGFLRSLSLDELPQLINIIKGDMSIIGPRPQLVRDMVFMSDEIRKRHLVKPGLSGLAQIHGRNAVTWDEKFAWDLKYIEDVSFINDIKILAITVKKIIRREESDSELELADDYGDELLKNGKITIEEYEQKQLEARKLLEGCR